MGDIISWFLGNWGVLLSLVFALLGVAQLITGLTNTPKDDAVVRKILDFLSFLKPKDAAGTFKVPLTRTPSPADDVIIERRAEMRGNADFTRLEGSASDEATFRNTDS